MVAGLGRAQPAATGFCRVVVGLTVVAITSGALGGCSAIAVRGPRTSSSGSAGTAPATREVVCDATYVPPVIDTAITLAATSLLVWSVTEPNTGETDGHTLTTREVAGVPSLLVLVPFAISAVYGFGKVSGCKRAARDGVVVGSSE